MVNRSEFVYKEIYSHTYAIPRARGNCIFIDGILVDY